MTSVVPIVSDLDRLPWDHRFTAALPADPEPENRRRVVEGASFTRVRPTPTAAPSTLAFSPEVAALLGLDEAVCRSADFAAVFSGNRVPAGADPFAMNYGGHQFGTWAGQLGDGRALALGEVVDRHGGHQTLQLKGAGPTPYSRSADGRAVLRSSIREFLCSEAMFHLGVPTTRALSLVATGDQVVRDVMYNGNPAPEPGAVVCRVAPSFTRFGNFQLPAARGEIDHLRALVDFTVCTDFPGFDPADIPTWLAEVCERTARLVMDWMRVGFVHGVLNTDNMSILGLTIDYGPYGWLESFDPDWTPNTTDAGTLRYRYGAQPQVALWNLVQLANALAALDAEPDIEALQAALDRFRAVYEPGFQAMTVARLGWGEVADGDNDLIAGMYGVLGSTEIDQVLFFRQLADVPTGPAATDAELLAPLADAWYQPHEVVGDVAAGIAAWLRSWGARATSGGPPAPERRAVMNGLNPRFVLRNYLAQEAIDQATAGDPSLVLELLDVMRHPYDEQPGRERFAAKRPEWARTKVGCSMLSCSS